ncbi:MAG: hypothetical protein C4316_04145 [Chloroflexota bacterium]
MQTPVGPFDFVREGGLIFLLALAGVAIGRGPAPALWGRLKDRLPWASRIQPGAMVGGLVVSYFAMWATFSYLRHASFHSHAYDLGILAQVMWNTVNGRPFLTTVMFEYTSNLLAHHFSPILLLIAPLYALWPRPETLLVVQAAALALAAIPFYCIGRRLGGEATGLALAVAYWLYPAAHYVNLFDFHEIALAVPLLAFALDGFLADRPRRGAVFAGLALLTREEVAIVTAVLGLWLFLRGQRGWGLGLMAGGIGWAALTIGWLAPALSGTGKYYYLRRYEWLGSSPGEIAATILTRPDYVLGGLLTRERLDFLLRLLLPLGLLPLLGPELLVLSVPSFGYLLLSNYREQYELANQYSAVVIPWLVAAAGAGAARLFSRRVSRGAVLGLLLGASLGAYLAYGPGPLGGRFEPQQFTLGPHVEVGRQILELIPPGAAVSAQSDLVPHLANRENLYTFPNIFGADYIVVDTKGSPWPLKGAEFQRFLERIDRNPAWRLVAARDGYRIYHRGSTLVSGPDLGPDGPADY